MFSPAPCIFVSILCAGLCIPGQSSYKSVFMVYIKRRVGVSCSVYDMLHTDAKGYIIMCKLVKLAFCLCCGVIGPRWYSALNFTAFTKLLNLLHKHVSQHS